MGEKVNPIPDDNRFATPYLMCKGAATALAFYEKAYGARVLEKIEMPGGVIGHAEVKIGDAFFMLAEECPMNGLKSPETLGGTSVTIHIYVEDVDALLARAVAAGAKVIQPIEDKFYGDRSVMLQDPCGHLWGFASRKENLTFDEIKKRSAALYGGSC